jgi:hypothetical protein
VNDFYNSGILSGPVDGKARLAAQYPNVEATPGLVVMHRASRFRGKVVRIEHDGALAIRSPNSGAERLFTMSPGAFAIDGETVTLVRPKPAAKQPGSTASGSVAVKNTPAKVAKASRIFVEGIHDAQLVEKVWGDDLRVEGIVVERLDGIDDLEQVVREFAPNSKAKLGILVDHLVAGSKESRIAASVANPFVTVTGTPYVDVWQAIRPSTLGIETWPVIPKGRSWKEGMCHFFGEPEPGLLWKKMLASVDSYADLEPSFVGAVESLIDFVTT